MGSAAAEAREEKPSPGQGGPPQVREDSGKGEEPTRVQDPQARDTPGVEQESGSKKDRRPRDGKKRGAGLLGSEGRLLNQTARC